MRTRYLSIAVLWAAVCSHVWGAPFTSASVGVSGAAYNRPVGAPYQCSNSGTTDATCGYTHTGTLPWNSSTGLPWAGLGNTFSGSATAKADGTGLKAKSHVDVIGYPVDHITSANNYSSSFIDSAQATASWSDTLTTVGPAFGSVIMTWVVHLDGLVTVDGGAGWPEVEFWSPQYYRKWSRLNFLLPGGGTINQDLVLSIPVTPGSSFNYSLTLRAKSEIGASLLNNVPRLVTQGATADFSHTLTLQSVGFNDSNGNTLEGYSVNSTSGHDYNQYSGVPEPSAFLPLGAALLIFARHRRRS